MKTLLKLTALSIIAVGVIITLLYMESPPQIMELQVWQQNNGRIYVDGTAIGGPMSITVSYGTKSRTSFSSRSDREAIIAATFDPVPRICDVIVIVENEIGRDSRIHPVYVNKEVVQ